MGHFLCNITVDELHIWGLLDEESKSAWEGNVWWNTVYSSYATAQVFTFRQQCMVYHWSIFMHPEEVGVYFQKINHALVGFKERYVWYEGYQGV